MSPIRHILIPASFAALAACASETTTASPGFTSRHVISVPESGAGAAADVHGGGGELQAAGNYHFFVPADYNGGIFGGSVDNTVEFEAHKGADGTVGGHFHYVQIFDGTPFTFSGRVTCLAIYDTPVLANWPGIPAMTHNRAKWGGIIDYSSDPTTPVGTYIWFQSIDNKSHGPDRQSYPDLSTISGFGDSAANAAFCAAFKVPNPNFGPHAAGDGQINVK